MVALVLVGVDGCTSTASTADSELDSSSESAAAQRSGPITWISPARPHGVAVVVGEVVSLTALVDTPVTIVRFEVDGSVVARCDTSAGSDECRRGDLVRAAVSFSVVGQHDLSAVAWTPQGDRMVRATLDVVETAALVPEQGEGEGEVAAADAGPTTERGFLDPDRPRHSVFGGVAWTVSGQSVGVTSLPTSGVEAIDGCMRRYGTSILRHADARRVSRGSIVATAIAESNCTNPSGSSDGLSSGPMQVTGATCAAVVGGGISNSSCKRKMHADPDFSFEVAARYMSSTGQRRQHAHDPPKISAAYNAGAVRRSGANRWHMVSTGNHIDRWVAAYNAYRTWERAGRRADGFAVAETAAPAFNGEHVATVSALPAAAVEGQVYFVGDWGARDGRFVTRRLGQWVAAE